MVAETMIEILQSPYNSFLDFHTVFYSVFLDKGISESRESDDNHQMDKSQHNSSCRD